MRLSERIQALQASPIRRLIPYSDEAKAKGKPRKIRVRTPSRTQSQGTQYPRPQPQGTLPHSSSPAQIQAQPQPHTQGQPQPEKVDAFVSRGDFALKLNEAFNLSNARRPKGARSPFQSSRHRHAHILDVLGPLGVLDVYKKDPEFRFGRPVTRGEAADMLVRAMVAAKIPAAR